jgi:glycosyltransferase involved in cell wall biosynthesis
MSTVSVIIPTYNHRDYILHTLASVASQTYAVYEIIVVNDSSPDDTATLLRPLAETGRIRYIQQENAGVAAARNHGLREARGDLIAFLDDDDYWPDDKIEWQVRYLNEHPEAGVIVGDIALVDGAGNVKKQAALKPGPITLEEMLAGSSIWSPGQTLVRKSLFAGRHGFDENIRGSDDYDLWLDFARSTRMVMDSRLALYYRLHPGNASRDALAMCLNTQRVLRRHMPFAPSRSRGELRLRATKWLYDYRGKFAIREWKQRVLRGQWRDSLKYISAMGWFIKGAVSDRRLFAAICKEMLPQRLVESIDRRKRRCAGATNETIP